MFLIYNISKMLPPASNTEISVFVSINVQIYKKMLLLAHRSVKVTKKTLFQTLKISEMLPVLSLEHLSEPQTKPQTMYNRATDKSKLLIFLLVIIEEQ